MAAKPKTVGNALSLAELRKFKINKQHIKKLTVTELNNLKKAVEAHPKSEGGGCQVCCCTPV
jgi:hypothetical protein